MATCTIDLGRYLPTPTHRALDGHFSFEDCAYIPISESSRLLITCGFSPVCGETPTCSGREIAFTLEFSVRNFLDAYGGHVESFVLGLQVGFFSLEEREEEYFYVGREGSGHNADALPL
jgi:hypothetical protein